MVAQIASLHLAPTDLAAGNLRAEGVDASQIVTTGNTVIDALSFAAARGLPYGDDRLETAAASRHPMVVVTAHRRESWGAATVRISGAVAALARLHPEVTFVVASHMNPDVRVMLEREVTGLPNVILTGPMGYGPFARLLARAQLVLTDSGGIQEEAPAFGVPVLVMRDTTERPEGVAAGLSTVVGTNPTRIVAKATTLLADAHHRTEMVVTHTPAVRATPYGDGEAARRCVEACGWRLGFCSRPDDFAFEATADVGRVVLGR
jgi:UDP-N-acetylglucosamine 2-epimerase (non-hydrolysing)